MLGEDFPGEGVVVEHDVTQLLLVTVESNGDGFTLQWVLVRAKEQIVGSCMGRADVYHLLEAGNRCCQ